MARRGTRGLAAAAALVLALVACGGDGDGDEANEAVEEPTTELPATTEAEPADEPGDTEPADEPDDTTEPPDETTTTVAGGLTEDEAAAIPDAVDLTLEDVTEYDPTFVEDPADDDEEDDGFDDCFAEVDDLETIAEGDGRAFEAELAYTASATTVMAREDDAIAAVDTFGSEPFRACFEGYLSEEGLTAQIDAYPSGARFGDQWAILAGSLEAEGMSFGVELHVVRTGPVLTLFMHLDLGDSGEATAYVVDGLLTLIDERQTAAVG